MKIFFLTLLVFIVGCKSDEEQFVYPNDQIKEIIESFDEGNNCNKCIHEIFIDKQMPYLYQIVIYEGQRSLIDEENIENNQRSLCKTVVNGHEYKIYSGIEHYFNNMTYDNSRKTAKIDSIIPYHIMNSKTWIVRDSCDIITVDKDITEAYPYLPPPIKIKMKFN